MADRKPALSTVLLPFVLVILMALILPSKAEAQLQNWYVCHHPDWLASRGYSNAMVIGTLTSELKGPGVFCNILDIDLKSSYDRACYLQWQLPYYTWVILSTSLPFLATPLSCPAPGSGGASASGGSGSGAGGLFPSVVGGSSSGSGAGGTTGIGPSVGGGASLACAGNFAMVPNAGIPANNTETLKGLSIKQCLSACLDRQWCRSADYKRETGTCYLQKVGPADLRLNYNYAGDPFDHYFVCTPAALAAVDRSKGTVLTSFSTDSKVEKRYCRGTFTKVANAGLPGHNKKALKNRTLSQCQAACLGEDWCLSVDYKRASGLCYLQPVGPDEVALKYTYSGNPYDHYYCN